MCVCGVLGFSFSSPYNVNNKLERIHTQYLLFLLLFCFTMSVTVSFKSKGLFFHPINNEEYFYLLALILCMIHDFHQERIKIFVSTWRLQPLVPSYKYKAFPFIFIVTTITIKIFISQIDSLVFTLKEHPIQQLQQNQQHKKGIRVLLFKCNVLKTMSWETLQNYKNKITTINSIKNY